MVSLHPEYVVDEQRNPKAVLLPFAEWQMVVRAMEDLADIPSCDEAKTGDLERLPFEQAVREIQADE